MRRFGLLIATAGALVAFTAGSLLAPAAWRDRPHQPAHRRRRAVDRHARCGGLHDGDERAQRRVVYERVVLRRRRRAERWIGRWDARRAVERVGLDRRAQPQRAGDHRRHPGFGLVRGTVVLPGCRVAPARARCPRPGTGRSWTLCHPGPAGGHAPSAGLASVSCVATTVCEVLGTAVSGATGSVFGNQWNGTSLVARRPRRRPTGRGSPPSIAASGMELRERHLVPRRRNHGHRTPTAMPFSEEWNGIVLVPRHGPGAERARATGSLLRVGRRAPARSFCAGRGAGQRRRPPEPEPHRELERHGVGDHAEP